MTRLTGFSIWCCTSWSTSARARGVLFYYYCKVPCQRKWGTCPVIESVGIVAHTLNISTFDGNQEILVYIQVHPQLETHCCQQDEDA